MELRVTIVPVDPSEAARSCTGISADNGAGCVAAAELKPLQGGFLPVCSQLFNPWTPMKGAAYPGADLKVSVSIARRGIQARENRCTKCLLLLLLLQLQEGERGFLRENDVTGSSLSLEKDL